MENPLANSVEGFRLSPQQKRLWQQRQDGAIFRAQAVARLDGDLRPELLRRAAEIVVARHESLRTTLVRPAGVKTPLQFIASEAAIAWRQLELAELTSGEREARLESARAEAAASVYDDGSGPSLCLSLLGWESGAHLLVVTLPALCADTWSLGNLLEELARAYAAGAAGAAGMAPEDGPVQYVQFSEWLNDLADGEEVEAGREFWRRQEVGAIPPLALPGDGHAAPRAEFAPATIGIELAPGAANRVEALATRHECAASIALLACWQALLWRLTGESDVVIGYVASGRKYEDLREAIGLFARTTPLRARLDERMEFASLLRATRDAVEAAEGWQEYFSWDELEGPAPDASGAPRLPICFEADERPRARRAGAVTFTTIARMSCYERFRLKLTSLRQGDALRAELIYDRAALDAVDVRRLAGQFETLVASAAGDRARLGDLDILPEAERRQILDSFSHSVIREADDRSIQQLFEEQAARAPDRVALCFGDQQLTYARLESDANKLAHCLGRRGAGPDMPVGFCVRRSPLMISGLLGILKSGAAYLPLDPDHPRERLAYQLEDARAPLLIAESATLDRFEGYAGRIVRLDDADLFVREPATPPAVRNAPQSLCYVIYTSGSTGRPKGVGVTHRGLVNYTRSICEKLSGADGGGECLSYATVTTISADLGNTAVFPSLASGGCLHTITYEVATDGRAFAEYVRHRPIDALKIVPSHLRALLASGSEFDFLPRRYLVLGGEALTYDLVRRVEESSSSCAVINHYGPTETTVGSLMRDPREGGDAQGVSATVPIGRPIANTEVFIFECGGRRLAPIGLPGELFIGGAGLARCYLNRPAETAEKFTPHPFSSEPGSRLYSTGDLARYLPNGEVEFLGRVDHQVKLRGFRVELGEIEAALTEHAGVREAVVVAREDEPGRRRLVGYLVTERKTAPAVEELRQFLGRRLPDYMIPAALVTLDAIPLTRNGKIDRKALPAPGHARPDGGRPYAAPRDGAEETLAAIWAQALGVEQVGIHDNFFELGGDSILSIQIVARAKQAGINVTIKQLFQHRTIAELAPVIGAAQTSSAGAPPAAEQGPVTGRVPLTPIQRWFFDLDLIEPSHFNQSLLFKPAGRLDARYVERAASLLVEHHDQLRATFRRMPDGSWAQEVAPHDEAHAPFVRLDLTAASDAELPSAVERECERLQRGFNLATGPLLLVALIECGQRREQRLFVAAHHLVVDGVSWRVLLEDLQTVYSRPAAGEGPRLPAKTCSFQRWAEMVIGRAREPQVEAEADYWRRAVSKAAPPLPRDFPGDNLTASARAVIVSLTPEETQKMLRLAPAAYGASAEDALLCAVGEALRRWTRARVTLVEMEGHGREEFVEGLDVSRTVGWFTTHYPVELEGAAEFDAGEALRRVKERLRGIPARGMNYGLLKYFGGMEAVAEPEVSFNYLGQVDRLLDAGATLSLAGEPSGLPRSPLAKRPRLLQIDAMVEGGRLKMIWGYSEGVHRSETIERVAGEALRLLEEVVGHCATVESRGYTPSDFPLAGLDQRQLDAVLSRVGKAKGRLI
jgi:amino acid adenylation domain-containing protein/non-ribosomal peptide synthase protein (TIGR01720 family)